MKVASRIVRCKKSNDNAPISKVKWKDKNNSITNEKIIKSRSNKVIKHDSESCWDQSQPSGKTNKSLADLPISDILIQNNNDVVNQKPLENKTDNIYMTDKLKRCVKQLSKYRTMKTSIKQVFIDDTKGTNSKILFDAVIRTHKIVIHVYMFMRLYILNKYHKKQVIPIINKDFISMVIKALRS